VAATITLKKIITLPIYFYGSGTLAQPGKKQGKWHVADHHGKFKTRVKYNNRDEAMAVITRHCRVIE